MKRRFGSVRVRAAAASTFIVGVAFVSCAFGVLAILRGSLYSSVSNTAQAQAIDITSIITTRGHLPYHLPIAGDETAAQIVGAGGAVVSSSRNVAGQAAMANLRPGPGAQRTVTGVVLHLRRLTQVDLDLDARFVVAAAGFRTARLTGTVLVADSLGAADHAVTLVELALAIALPILALLVGLLVWILTGWSLRPVELIRSEVDELSATDLYRRVHEPAVQDEIGRLARTMNALLTRLEHSNERQRQLVADVSHELRNPLAALRAQLEVVTAHPDGGSLRLLEGSLVEVVRMSRLVEDLLTLARLDEGVLTLHLGEVDLDDLVLVHAARLRSRGTVRVSVAGVGAARLRADEAQLDRVVANLADNAGRHAVSRVEFAVRLLANSVRLTVSDDGPGVPPADRQRVFGRFVRLDSARTHEDSGAGLGLAIVREIVSAHGGTVWIDGDAPGARFVVDLPVSDVSPPRPDAGPRRRATPHPDGASTTASTGTVRSASSRGRA